MSPNDIIFEDLTEKQLQSLRVDASFRKKVLTQLKKLENELVSKITEEDTFTQRRLKDILSSVRESIDKAYDYINSQMKKDIRELTKVEATEMIRTITKAASTVDLTTAYVTIKSVIESVDNSLIAGAPSEEWWGRQKTRLKERFTDEVRTGILLGESNDKLVRRVRGTKALGYTDGVMNAARNDAEALVRSSVQNATNQARFKVMEDNNDIVSSYKHVATLDGRTSEVCVVRDGKRWDAKTKKPIGHNIPFQVPPIHWNCRSTLIVELKGVKIPDEATRASESGQVPASTTFEDFLKKKGEAFTEEVLGSGKAKLYRDGKITLRQLLDQSGNPLTLKQLKQKYGV